MVRNLTLSTKLIGGFMAMGALLLMGGLVGSFGISQVDGRLRDVSEVHLPGMHSIGVITESQIAIQRIGKALVTPDRVGGRGNAALFKDYAETLTRVENAYRRYDTIPKERGASAAWNRLKPTWKNWLQGQNQFIELMQRGQREEAAALLAGPIHDSFVATENLLGELSDLTMHLSDKSVESGLTQAFWLNAVAIGGTMIGSVIAFAFGVFFARSITVPINRAIAKLTETASQFAEGAAQLALSNNRLAEETTKQAEEVEKTSGVMRDLASVNHDHDEQVRTIQKTTHDIDVIREEAFTNINRAAEAMKEIRESSEKTSEALVTIEKISFQTNLLALNASVEAARAGEAGAGFAVVADEVRTLALEATEATKNTSTLIEGAGKAISKGEELMGTSSAKFGEYSDFAINFVSTIDRVAGLSDRQIPIFQQIERAIEEINRVVHENAAHAEESAAATEEMTSQSEAMKDYVKKLEAVIGTNGHTVSPKLVVTRRPFRAGEDNQTLLGISAHGGEEVQPC